MPVKKGREGMKTCMEEFKAGTLHSGGDGKVVTDRKQAIAICLRSSGQSRPQPPKGKR
jgi:hypothetical protein